MGGKLLNNFSSKSKHSSPTTFEKGLPDESKATGSIISTKLNHRQEDEIIYFLRVFH